MARGEGDDQYPFDPNPSQETDVVLRPVPDAAVVQNVLAEQENMSRKVPSAFLNKRGALARSRNLANETCRFARVALKHWEAYQAWKSERNPARAELERRHGYDTKHAMHLVRLMRTGLELLQAGELRVRREDAADLNAVRGGAMTFEELQNLAGDLQGKMLEAATTTSLPADVDHAFVDRMAFEMICGGA
jgi:hypothetical protein